MRQLSWIVVIASLFAFASLLFTIPVDAGCQGVTHAYYGSGSSYAQLGSMRCVIREIDSSGRLFVEDESDGRQHWVTLPESAKVLAGYRNRARFDGRKKLTVDDLEPGQRIRVSSFKRSGEILSVRVIRPNERMRASSNVVLADLAFQP